MQTSQSNATGVASVTPKQKPVQASPGRITGTGTVTRADGTVIDFTIQSESTEAQAERLGLLK